MAKNLISIIIVNYNVKDLIISCLESIYANNSENFELEILVIDNNSSDDSCQSIREKFPEVTLLENKFNAGFSGANNQGLEIAKGNYVYLLNPDTEIHENSLQLLLNYLEENPNCSLVAPQLLNSDGSLQVSAWKEHAPIDLIMETFFLHKFINRLNYPSDFFSTNFSVKALSGAALFFNKKLSDRIGGLNPSYFWMEDIDFCKRALKQGELMYLHEAKVTHHSGQSQKKNYNIAICNQLLSKLKYYKNNFPFLSFVVASFCCFLFILTRLFAFTIFSPIKKVYFLKMKAYFYTFKKFFTYILFKDTKLT